MQIIIDDARAIARVRKHIKYIVPSFTGKRTWLIQDVKDQYEFHTFDKAIWQYRFMTVTFDPRKFSANELSQPYKLINYFQNAMLEMKNLLKGLPIIVMEFHKSGIPHFHINYSTEGVLELNSFILRMRYYFSKDLRTRATIHDRIFNDHGKDYIQKSNDAFFTYKI